MRRKARIEDARRRAVGGVRAYPSSAASRWQFPSLAELVVSSCLFFFRTHLLHSSDDDVADITRVPSLQRADAHELVDALDDPRNISYKLAFLLIRPVASAMWWRARSVSEKRGGGHVL